jgi:hypothetical protein
VAASAQTYNFLRGFAWGAALALVGILVPMLWPGARDTAGLYRELVPGLGQLWQLARLNLQGSILPFALVLLGYWIQLHKLRRLFADPQPRLEAVVRHEQLLDLCANLFFGIGVIWTAIGMRNALLYALGDPGFAAEQGAFAILQRLVEGGILLALSTTIVGGLGGYVMRLIKTLSLGKAMTGLYMRASQQPLEEQLDALQRIERLLENNRESGSQSQL